MKQEAISLDNQVLRDVALNREELLNHAKEIAQSHSQITLQRGSRNLVRRSERNSKLIRAAYQAINDYAGRKEDDIPAAEWFLDNYYVISGLNLSIKKNLPRRFERELPAIVTENTTALPRVYLVMQELVEHADSQISSELLRDFVNAYQEYQPLSSGELWAIPIMLNILLLENIRRMAERILLTQREREKAESWIAPLLEGELGAEQWEGLISADNMAEFSPAYAERLLHRIRDLGIEAAPLQRWFDRVLSKNDRTLEGLAHLEHQQQARLQVSMGHAVTSIRFIVEEDWPVFFEEISPVQKLLAEDPAGVYAAMDFKSRDYYRHKVEKLARAFRVSELVIARKVLARAEGRKAKNGPDVLQAHVGYDLVGVGYPSLEKELEKEWGRLHKLWCSGKRAVKSQPRSFYMGGIALAVLLFLALLAPILFTPPLNPGIGVLALVLLAVIGLGMIIPFFNFLVARFVQPAFLPKLELAKGIPPNLSTMVVIPTLLPSSERVRELLAQLEIYYLGNKEKNIYYALLGDFTDASTVHTPEDKAVLDEAIAGIQELNRKHGGEFFFFHRARRWNPTENIWMGWERKRGKLVEFNQLLRQKTGTSYEVQIGNLEVLPTIRYVITLDADTILPRDAAKKLIGTLAHPLHRASLDGTGKKVVAGYGVLQPRVGVSVQCSRASRFAALFSGYCGIDLYTTAVSDVYQDLFGEGIFTGKGIYDVDVFHQVTGQAFPENKILSHDLIEGLYARAGLVTDIELIDGYPAKYQSYMRRLHRWTRGDWQILPWLFKDLSFLAKWKIADNLRRSLEPLCQLLLLLLAFTVLPGSIGYWLGLVVLAVFWPSLLFLGSQLLKGDSGRFTPLSEVSKSLQQGGFQLAILPFQAFTQGDAILRSLYRQVVTERKMLEWETAADAEKRFDLQLSTSLRTMWPSWLIVLFFLAGVVLFRPWGIVAFLPLGILWGMSPWFAHRASLPLVEKSEELSWGEKRELQLWSRQIWGFFEEYITAEENWLPPDNVQVDPPNGTAHRTSPTNIGLALLANLAARDWGYLTLTEMLSRIRGTLTTLDRLKRWKGHFYNWYDTLSLEPLQPTYISTVDSGNLAVSFFTLSRGLEELPGSALFGKSQLAGLRDTYELILKNQGEEITEVWKVWEQRLSELEQSSDDLVSWYAFLQVPPPNQVAEGESSDSRNEAGFWAQRLSGMVEALNAELQRFFPVLLLGIGTEEANTELPLANLAGYSPQSLLELYRREALNSADEARRSAYRQGERELSALLAEAEAIGEELRALAAATDFKPLYNSERQLFAIGYRLNDQMLDRSYYDMLASEARQASFIAIAKGDIPQEHWFRLGRHMTEVYGKRSLVSWSGTMFEFFMPLLFMRSYPGTLWDETYKAVAAIQQEYGKKRGVPWGISESGFYQFDGQLNYQYKAFGVPGLGLKRGLVQELVIAPYATFMALQVIPRSSLENLRQMTRMGFAGRFGLFEAIDFTHERLSIKNKYSVVKSYMAHHQGMSLLALNNVLLEKPMQERFHRDPLVQATELLLQERIPSVQGTAAQQEQWRSRPESHVEAGRDEGRHFVTYTETDTPVPLVHFIANGEYGVMLTNTGAGFSRCRGMAVSRWREDATRDHWGMYFYIENLNSGDFWSATYQPCGKRGEDYQVTFAADRVEYYRKDGNISTKTEVTVSPEDAAEIRRLSLTNHSAHERELEITSYFEVVLARPQDESAHPAFSNLFIQTEYEHSALFALRRPRRPEDGEKWLMHTVALEGEGVGALEYETDRARFLGRGGSLANPRALELNQPLSNTVGAVLNPIMSLRQRVLVKPGQTVRVSYSTGFAESRGAVLRMAEKYQDPVLVNRAFELAWTQSKMELSHWHFQPAEANEALGLGGQILYLSPARREQSDYLQKNRRGQSALWPYAISGDLPIVLITVGKMDHLEFVRYFLRVHEYWRTKGLQVDLVILNEDKTGYFHALQDRLCDMTACHSPEPGRMHGNVATLQVSHLPEEIVALLYSSARLVFAAENGSGPVQIRKKGRNTLAQPVQMSVPTLKWPKDKRAESGGVQLEGAVHKTEVNPTVPDELLFFNGLGGFTPDGKEYILELKEANLPPVPWINVVANPRFGFQISESGAGYTWSGNSRENKLTPWSNDPILDPIGEGILLRDEETGELWSPTPSPIREETPYRIRYGQGYARYNHASHGIDADYLLYVHMEHPLKIARLKLRNRSDRKRRLSASYFADWVLGVAREQTALYIVTEFEQESETLLARNTYQEEFAGRVAFLNGFGGTLSSYTGNRQEWLGRNGDQGTPWGLQVEFLSGETGAGFDPCGVVQRAVELEPGQEADIVFLLGEETSRETALALVQQYRSLERVESAFQGVVEFWDRLLGKIQVRTPEQSFDLLMNRWLQYQTLVCRIWARSAFYQSGGAYGFRDQLQDVMSLVQLSPAYTREQILRHCRHQFVEGDVQHWWHGETGKGIRTRFSDDLLWLPYVTADYLEHTGDYGLLDEVVPYLTDAPLAEKEHERYSIPQVSTSQGTVFEHCVKALERGLQFGEHGLPLIGSGDWNDGFSGIGIEGKGESVWLGWFILSTLKRFAQVCENRGETSRAEAYRQIAGNLNESLENSAWDGAWYRRAYFDDGTPLGSVRNAECQIDAIAQSWSVISGGARSSRAQSAMKALESYLWKKDEGIHLLLTPPFDKSARNPGYIQGYVPGVRENGGQYTHGAIWSVLAWTQLGEGNKAMELFHMLNPINHARTPQDVLRYKVEPYVMAADVYAIHPHTGRGGWTWYTGAAGWMYQVGLEGILGLSREGDLLSINPCLPSDWPGYEVDYAYGSSRYRLQIENPYNRMRGVMQILLDGKELAGNEIPLLEDGQEHTVKVILGERIKQVI